MNFASTGQLELRKCESRYYLSDDGVEGSVEKSCADVPENPSRNEVGGVPFGRQTRILDPFFLPLNFLSWVGNADLG